MKFRYSSHTMLCASILAALTTFGHTHEVSLEDRHLLLLPSGNLSTEIVYSSLRNSSNHKVPEASFKPTNLLKMENGMEVREVTRIDLAHEEFMRAGSEMEADSFSNFSGVRNATEDAGFGWLDSLDMSIREEVTHGHIPQRYQRNAARKVSNALDPDAKQFMRGDASRVVKDLTAGGMKTDATVQQLAEAFIDEGEDAMPGEMPFAAYLILKFGKHNLEAFAIGMALLVIMVIGITTCWADVERLSLRKM